VAAGDSRAHGRRGAILYCDQALSDGAEQFAQVVQSLGSSPRTSLVFRPHPVQSAFLLRLVVTGGTVDRSQTIVDAIRSSAVVVTHSSMVAVIAALLERPVILWNIDPTPPMPVLLIEKVAYWARSQEELSALLTRLLDAGDAHPLRTHQAAFRRELETLRSSEDFAAVLSQLSSEPPR
jgi:hypothetical protein